MLKCYSLRVESTMMPYSHFSLLCRTKLCPCLVMTQWCSYAILQSLITFPIPIVMLCSDWHWRYTWSWRICILIWFTCKEVYATNLDFCLNNYWVLCWFRPCHVTCEMVGFVLLCIVLLQHTRKGCFFHDILHFLKKVIVLYIPGVPTLV